MSLIETIGLGFFMILKNNNEDLNLEFKFRVDDYDYNVYGTLGHKDPCYLEARGVKKSLLTDLLGVSA